MASFVTTHRAQSPSRAQVEPLHRSRARPSVEHARSKAGRHAAPSRATDASHSMCSLPSTHPAAPPQPMACHRAFSHRSIVRGSAQTAANVVLHHLPSLGRQPTSDTRTTNTTLMPSGRRRALTVASASGRGRRQRVDELELAGLAAVHVAATRVVMTTRDRELDERCRLQPGVATARGKHRGSGAVT